MVKFIIVRTRKIDEFKAKTEHSFHVPCLPEGRLFFNTTEPYTFSYSCGCGSIKDLSPILLAIINHST